MNATMIMTLLEMLATEREKNRQLLAVIEWQDNLISAKSKINLDPTPATVIQ